eukprot:230538_1
MESVASSNELKAKTPIKPNSQKKKSKEFSERLSVMSVYTNMLIFIMIIITFVSSNEYKTLWYDDMEVGADWNVTGKASDEKSHCAIGQCVRIIGGSTIKREYLSTQNYDHIQLSYSVQVTDLRRNEFCSLYYSINGAYWVLLKQYGVLLNDEAHFNEILDLPFFTFNIPNVQIKFNLSNYANGSCYIDELYMNGLSKVNVPFSKIPQVIWYDNMETGDNWYFENTSDHTKHCYIGDCVQLNGNSYIERDGLNTKYYKNIQLRYSIKTINLQKGEYCQVFYSVDNDYVDWILITSYNELFNDHYQINEVMDLPLDADNNKNIGIKFNLTSKINDSEEKAYCYMDEVYLLGIKEIVINLGYIRETHILFAVLTYNLFF